MKARDRILDAAMLVFSRYGYRRSSVEQTAEAAGLTRQALYHHFETKEALFRAVIARLHETALEAEVAATDAQEKAGGGLADILIVQIFARLRHVIDTLAGSPHTEELLSEHLAQGRDLYRSYSRRYGEHRVAIIKRICRQQGLVLADGMTARNLSRCIEIALNGVKSAHPTMQPVDAFLKDLEIMVRTLIAGSVRPAKTPTRAKPAKVTKLFARRPGGRK